MAHPSVYPTELASLTTSRVIELCKEWRTDEALDILMKQEVITVEEFADALRFENESIIMVIERLLQTIKENKY